MARFQPGQSGNPKGRPKLADSAREVLGKLAGKDGKAYAEQLHAIATGAHNDIHARLKALGILVPYMWGKPTEQVEHAVPEPIRILWKMEQ